MKHYKKLLCSLLILMAFLVSTKSTIINGAFSQSVSKHVIKIVKRHVVGNKKVRVNQGDSVEIHWETDEDVKLHLHGYDIEVKAISGKTRIMKFVAKATGRFPVKSHGFGNSMGHSHGKSALIYFEVHPK